MAASFVDEYMLKLGATVDASGMARFQQALREASNAAHANATSIAGAFFKAQTEIVGGFLAIGTAAVGLADKVAKADLSYSLFALHMYTTKQVARDLTVTMDALGMSLSDLTFGPKELQDRAHDLMERQRRMAPEGHGGDFEEQMRKIREITYEFTSMEVELQYLSMYVVEDFMKALGMAPDTLLKKLRVFNNWVIDDMPQIAQKLVTLFMPVWKDVEGVIISTKDALVNTGTAFTNIVGLLTGDSSIEGETFNLEKFAKALEYVAKGFYYFAVGVNGVIEEVTKLTAALASLASNPLARAALSAISPLAGVAFSTGDLLKAGNDSSTGAPAGMSGSAGSSITMMVAKQAFLSGIDPAVALALATQESGLNPNAVGHKADGTASGALGVMQLIQGTASRYGVTDRLNPEENIRGGLTYLAHLMKQYGNMPTAIMAYHEGEGKMSRVFAPGSKESFSSEGIGEVIRVMRASGARGDVHIGSIVVHLDQPGLTNEHVGNVIAAKVSESQGKTTQRTLAQFGDRAWGYP